MQVTASHSLFATSVSMKDSQRSCVCFFVTLWLVGGLAAPVPPRANDAWDQVLDQAWLKAKPRISFCLGESESGVYNTILQSFPKPLPTTLSSEDAVCSNIAEVGRHLCGPKSLMEYYKVLFEPSFVDTTLFAYSWKAEALLTSRELLNHQSVPAVLTADRQ